VDDTETNEDAKASGDTSADDTGSLEGDAGSSRLDDLGDRIQSVRADAADVVEGVADADDKSYADSGGGASTDEDDQTIAPPG